MDRASVASTDVDDESIARFREATAAAVRAVEKARALRGTVMLEGAGDRHLWCAASGAADGRMQLLIGEPRRRWRPRRLRAERWLESQGFVHIPDAWALAVMRDAGAHKCAATLIAALEHALGWSGEPLIERLTHPGVGPAGAPPRHAPHEDHVAAALRSLVCVRHGRACISSGPASLWAWVWVTDGGDGLLIERDVPWRSGYGDDAWTVPLTDEGAQRAAEELVRRVMADRPAAVAEPLFIDLLGLPEEASS